jgi:malate dehydrogenase (oxaloacetate-decarboxylating)
VVLGCGAAGSAITKLLLAGGIKEIIVVDRQGIINQEDRTTQKNQLQTRIAEITNKKNEKGNITVALQKADVFIGVSSGDALKGVEIGKLMNEIPIIFALANPIPEINPKEAKSKGAYIVATGRSDYENQINNILSFPGFFKGLLMSRAKKITMRMHLNAAKAIANIVTSDELCKERIIADVFNEKIVDRVAEAVLKTVKNEN